MVRHGHALPCGGAVLWPHDPANAWCNPPTESAPPDGGPASRSDAEPEHREVGGVDGLPEHSIDRSAASSGRATRRPDPEVAAPSHAGPTSSAPPGRIPTATTASRAPAAAPAVARAPRRCTAEPAEGQGADVGGDQVPTQPAVLPPTGDRAPGPGPDPAGRVVYRPGAGDHERHAGRRRPRHWQRPRRRRGPFDEVVHRGRW
jgi:hypothetical protein